MELFVKRLHYFSLSCMCASLPPNWLKTITMLITTQQVKVKSFVIFTSFVQVNQTNQDWNLATTLEGVGFYGPPVMVAKSHLTTNYPLMFKPCYEGPVEVRDYFIGA